MGDIRATLSRPILALALLGAAGCWLPIVLTEPGSPMVIGRYWQQDGSPAVAAGVAVTSRGDDATCARALDRGTTDSMGVFQLRPTTVRQRGIWLIPPIERFGRPYWLCAGPADSALQMAYGGGVALGAPDTEADSVTCLEWGWKGRTRVNCTGPGEEEAIQTASSWSGDGGRGFYRLIVIDKPMWDARESGVFLQWVQQSETGPRETVRETVAFPMSAKLPWIGEARFWLPGGRPPCVSVETSGPPRSLWSGPHRERIAFELGPPGHMRRVATC
jgi:hypothetical protein